MKVKQLIGFTNLIKDQYITVTDHTNKIDYSSKGIGRYDFGRSQDTVLALKVNTFKPTTYGIHIDAE